MMLDPKRTFDELIERLAPDDETRDEILANRIYRSCPAPSRARRSSPPSPSSTTCNAPAAST